VLSREPPAENYPYAGWIPTANGHLSFRHIGETRHPTLSVYANVTTKQRRLVLGFQRRPLSDALFKWFSHRHFGLSGDFWFVISATSEGPPGNTEELLGTVFIYKSKADWDGCSPAIQKSINELNVDRLLPPADTRDAKLEVSLAQGVEKLKATADIAIDFWLNRSGEIFFAKPVFRDTHLGEHSIAYASLFGHDLLLWMANQTYFFLRDVSHGHQHHPPTSDTILVLQEREGGDRVTWRKNIIYSLQHYIIRSKRFADGKSLAQAAGVLSYCMSFRAICERHLGQRCEDIPVYNDAALMGSLRARAEEHEVEAREHEPRLKIAADRKMFALVFVGILVTILVFASQTKVDSISLGRLGALTDLALKNFFTVLFSLALFLGVIWITNPSKPRLTVPLFRDVYEIANVKRLGAIYASLIGFAAVMISTLWAAWPAVAEIAKVFSAFVRVLFY
jgi:hypothetical protein